MVEIELAAAIRQRLSESLKDLLLPTERDNEDPRPPKIVNGYLPPKRSNSESEFPFVIVRPSKGQTGQDGYSRMTAAILIGCFSEEFDGYEYAMQVLAKIRSSFMENQILDQRFCFELPFTWELYDDQPYPQWELKVTSEWSLWTPQNTSVEGEI